jgi:hypothetical protein
MTQAGWKARSFAASLSQRGLVIPESFHLRADEVIE